MNVHEKLNNIAFSYNLVFSLSGKGKKNFLTVKSKKQPCLYFNDSLRSKAGGRLYGLILNIRAKEGKLNGKRLESEANHERILTPENKLRVVKREVTGKMG